MPYFLIPLVASIALGVLFVTLTEARPAEKASVAVAVVISLFIWRMLPRLLFVATLIQVVVSIFVLMRWQWERSGHGR